jgi:inactivated superfamily I helicase
LKRIMDRGTEGFIKGCLNNLEFALDKYSVMPNDSREKVKEAKRLLEEALKDVEVIDVEYEEDEENEESDS